MTRTVRQVLILLVIVQNNEGDQAMEVSTPGLVSWLKCEHNTMIRAKSGISMK